jgi:predicted nucleic acid-binding protein
LRENTLLYKDQFAVLDLTAYEVCNAVWKGYRAGRVRDPAPVVRVFEEFMSGVKRLSVEQGMLEAFDIAVKNGITFYDASYVYVARKLGLKLVTEDSDLLKFPEAIPLEEMLKELKP